MQPPVPFDIIYEILQYCDVNTLLRVAITSRDCRSPAESFIYRTISLNNYMSDDQEYYYQMRSRVKRCLKLLAAHPDKACHTRVFCLQLTGDSTFYNNRPFFDILAAALSSVPLLDVLQLEFARDDHASCLLPTLQRCTFSPRIISVPQSLDPINWARFHDNIREVRFYGGLPELQWEPDPKKISVYRQWTAYSLNKLIVWQVKSGLIKSFPALNPCWSPRPIWEYLSIVSLEFNADWYIFSELLVSSVTRKTLIDNIKSLTEWFPAVKRLDLVIEEADSYEPSTVLSTALSLLPRLTELTMELLNGRILMGVSYERELQLAQSWAEVSPRLTSIRFLSGNIIDRDKGSGIWSLRPREADLLD